LFKYKNYLLPVVPISTGIAYATKKGKMARSGPIIVVEDDIDDQETFREVVEELGMKNQLIYFDNTLGAMQFLMIGDVQPFIIFCDVNLPMQNGLAFKKEIDGNPALRRKSIPFVFYTTTVTKQSVDEAYMNYTVQGFFQKPDTYSEIRAMLTLIFEYWKLCRHPNS